MAGNPDSRYTHNMNKNIFGWSLTEAAAPQCVTVLGLAVGPVRTHWSSACRKTGTISWSERPKSAR
jgi:hypothetical protein